VSEYRPLDALLPRPALPQIDLARSVIFLFRRDGERLLWASDAARRFLGLRLDDEVDGRRLGPLMPSTQRLKLLGKALQAGSPPRLERIPFFVNLQFEPLTCVCRIVPLRAGEEALLLTAKEVRITAPIAAEPDLAAKPAPLVLPREEQPEEMQRPAFGRIGAENHEPAAWSAPARASLRFTFDSDRSGRIETVSSEFARAVGPRSAALTGLTWQAIANASGEPGAAELAALSADPAPFRNVVISWPMDDGRRAPIEISGAPRLVKGEIIGLRGFGLVRLADAAKDGLPEQELDSAPANEENDILNVNRIVDAVKAALPLPAETVKPERLTPQERNAFRDIAKALGARFEGDIEDEARASAALTAQPETLEIAAFSEENVALDSEFHEPAPHLPTPALEIAASAPAEPELTDIVGDSVEIDDQQVDPELPNDDFSTISSDMPVEETPSNTEEERDSAPSPSLDLSPAEDVIAEEPPAPAELIHVSDGDLLDRLPIGLLVARDGQALYANRTLLDLVSHDSAESIESAGGLSRLFAGPIPDVAAEPPITGTRLRTSEGNDVLVDAHLQIVPWNGAAATLFSFRRLREDVRAKEGAETALVLARAGGNAALEAQLRAREAELAEYRAMLDTATDGVISLTSDGRMLAANRPVEALFGYDAPELVGERLTKLFASESQAAVVDYLDGLNANGVQSILAEGRNVFGRESQGGRIPLFLTIGRVSSSGKLCAVLRDMTNWRKAEADLTAARMAADTASQQKSQFLAKISHEIRTPMNSIIGFAEVMMDQRFGAIGNDRYAEYLRDIHRSGQHVVSLVNDLLDLSKVEAGKADLTFASVNLNDIVSSCVSMMEPQALREKVFLRTQLDSGLPMVVADERSIRQIVINLLSNSAKFNNPGGQIIVSTALTPEREAVIRVKDTGIGMTPEELELAMQPFRQIPATAKSGGTGLGLPLTKALTEANRASLRIVSRRGEGTMAEIVFPTTRVLAE
jgi:PAS domain S-box-containing protein